MNKINIDFFVIGAQKSGTTTIHNWLVQNEQISLPNIKETHFFNHNYQKGMKWYNSRFKKKCKIRGEVDPSYLLSKRAALNIKKHFQAPKFIILLRKPIDRAYSHYLMTKFRGLENKTFYDAINCEKSRIEKNEDNFYNFSYLTRSEYVKQIQVYKEYFPNSEFYFIKFEDIVNNKIKQSTYDSLCSFVGVNNNNINFNVKSNSSKTYRFKILSKLLYDNYILRKIINFLGISDDLKYYIKKNLDKLNSRDLDKNMKYEKNNIMQFLDEENVLWNNKEVELLEKLTKLSLSKWKI